ncbi:peptidase S41 [Flavobacterium akiainvivens]|uniref:Peptidase S41 n=1 Tax=Flavobacterium akiainvivens TaxID=1202724 RepID=A0A0M9VHZ1_9FLAO|nr:S41 family peptidase [Flavobacterium akiainvivens]KOS06096.1 peptidase S41 [Flavobacterium akiainvivens]SFQ54902.1 Peptidase family S41 [Flavobacterium akiainvivens]
MKKISLYILLLLAVPAAFISCEDQDDTAVPINDFIWKGLNLYYLWQADVPALSDDHYTNQEVLNNFIQPFTPGELFESLLYQRGTVDRWSVMYSDYNVLENALQGTYKIHGAEFGLVRPSAGSNTLFGYVRYILPNSDASTKNIHRGDIFYAVNGTALTVDNYQELLSAETYTLNFADYNGTTLTPNGQEVSLTRFEYSENPIYTGSVVSQGGHNIGYLMYNGFYSGYNNALNDAFGQLKGAGVTDLVLDLRYNGGGSVQTATYLASMITGQFNGQLFAQQEWNAKLMAHLNQNDLQNLFTDNINGTAINSLNLNKVYILTTGSTASASELVINCLTPYIDVVVIGTTTTGKNVGSVTLYDSMNFSRSNRTSAHRYAMQPIVLRTINADGFGDYSAGIDPTIELPEDYTNMGELGNASEPLFAAAISDITANGRHGNFRTAQGGATLFKGAKELRQFGTEMYIDNLPQNLPLR